MHESPTEATPTGLSGLERDLRAPIRTLRLFALEGILQRGGEPALLPLLQELAPLEEDEECQALFGYAIELSRLRTPTSDAAAGTAGTAPATEAGGDGPRSVRLQLNALRALSGGDLERFLAEFPSLLEREKNPLVAGVLVEVFGAHCPADRLELLRPLLQGRFANVRSAALKALQRRNPAMLLEALPELLRTRDPRKRAIALLGLAGIDPEEAVRHLERFLFHKDPGWKRFGLQTAVLMSFPLVKDLLLRFISLDRDRELVGQAGAIIRANPDPEIPYRLCEMLEKSAPSRGAFLKELVEQTCESIRVSRILGSAYEAYQRKLQDWVTERAARAAVEKALGAAAATDGPPVETLRLVLGERLRHPAIQQVLQEATGWELAPPLLEAVRSLVGRASGPEPSGPSIAPPEAPESSEKQRLRDLARADLQGGEAARRAIEAVLGDAQAPNAVRAMALRLAAAREIKGWENEATRWLLAGDPLLVAGSLEYLTAVDAERVFPYLGTYLASPDPMVKLKAILLLKRFDPPQALSALMVMIRNPDPRKHQLLVTSLVQFEFAILREPLTEFLVISNGTVFLREALCLFRTNPAPENLPCLLSIREAVYAEQSRLVAAALAENEALLVKFGILSETRIAGIKAEWAAAQARKKAQRAPPPYAASRFAWDADEDRDNLLVRLGAYCEALTPRQIVRGLGVLAVVFFSWSLLTSWLGGGGPGPQEARGPSGPGSGKPVANVPLLIADPDQALAPVPAAGEGSGTADPTPVRMLQTSARAITTGERYAQIMAQRDREEEVFRQDMARHRQEYLEHLAGDGNEHPLMRLQAEALLHPAFAAGKEAFDGERYDQAESELIRVLNDPAATPLTRALACQMLIPLARKRQDQDAFARYVARLGKELSSLPEFKEFENLGRFEEVMKQLGAMKELARTDLGRQKLVAGFTQAGESPERAKEMLSSLNQFQQDEAGQVWNDGSR